VQSTVICPGCCVCLGTVRPGPTELGTDWNPTPETDHSAAALARYAVQVDAANGRPVLEPAAFPPQPLNDMSIRQAVRMWRANRAVCPPIATWDVHLVTNMDRLFADSDFNDDIGGWNTESVTTMADMFRGALAFNQLLQLNTQRVEEEVEEVEEEVEEEAWRTRAACLWHGRVQPADGVQRHGECDDDGVNVLLHERVQPAASIRSHGSRAICVHT
jgi:surface protein